MKRSTRHLHLSAAVYDTIWLTAWCCRGTSLATGYAANIWLRSAIRYHRLTTDLMLLLPTWTLCVQRLPLLPLASDM